MSISANLKDVSVSLLNSECLTNEKIELGILGLESSGSPYRASDAALDAFISLPSGRETRVPCFLYVDHRRSASELYPKRDSAAWRLRFATGESGIHRCRFVFSQANRQQLQFEGPDFSVDTSDARGPIRISKRSPRYLEFEDGASFVPVGQNTCFRTERSSRIPVYPDCGVYSPTASIDYPWNEAYRRWWSRMSESGANWARIWMRPDFYLEDGEPWQFNQENAFRLDHVLEQARSLGIYVCLCMDDVRNLFHKIEGVGVANWFSGYDTAWRLLLEEQGCSSTTSFFTSALSREMMRDKLRYIIARWGYCNNVFCWELWNEIACVDAPEAVMAGWVAEMTQYIRENDPYSRPIKSPYSDTSAALLTKTYGDINDAHPYYGWQGSDKTRDFAEFVGEVCVPLQEASLPYMVGEGGIAREVKTEYGLAAELADRDLDCVHVHEALWGAVFAGSCGTGMVWWWDEHIDLKDCYWRFKGISSFIKGVPFNVEPFELERPLVTHSLLRAKALRGESIYLLWIQSCMFTWWSAIKKEPLPTISGACVSICGLSPGRYRLELWSTTAGSVDETRNVVVENECLEVHLPTISTDLAVKLIKEVA